MRWSPVNAAGRGPITVRDALAYAAAVTGPVRVITCIAIATAASAHARGDLTVLFPRSWEAQVMAAVGLPYVREAVAALMTATRTMHPVLLLLALQAAVILTTLLMVRCHTGALHVASVEQARHAAPTSSRDSARRLFWWRGGRSAPRLRRSPRCRGCWAWWLGWSPGSGRPLPPSAP